MSEELARKFHEVYERLAPNFGYETRTETRKFDPTTPNGRLMIAVTDEIENELRTETERLKNYVNRLLSEETRIWKCENCGMEFESCYKGKWELENGDATVVCPQCDGVAHTLSSILKAELARLTAELAELREEQEKDYAGMRDFQAKFIKADQELLELRERVRRARAAFFEDGSDRDAANRMLEALGEPPEDTGGR